MYTVAVSYLEWIRWVATGWFRCADRVVWVDGADDQSDIDVLLDRTPDLQVSDDQGYVIACLRIDSLISGRVSGRERSVGHLWLSVGAVSSFHPLSIRGARLLEADAERAAVRLGEPLFEKAWADWRDRRLEDEAHWRGLSLCVAFGLDKPELKDITHPVCDVLAGRKAAPNAAKAREDAIEGTRALGWASAMSIAVMESDVRAAFKESSEFGRIQSLIKSLRNDFDLGHPLLDDETTVTFVRGIDLVLRKLGAKVLPLELMATVLHYRSLATGGRQLSLDALVEDLVAIALEDPHFASLAAYFIGRSMENVAVTTLLYQSEPARYAALAPAAGRKQLSVMSLAARRLEAQQPVDEDQKANPGGAADVNSANQNPDTISGSAEETVGEQPVGDQQTVLDGADSLPGDSSAVAVSVPVPPDDSSVAGLPTVSLFGLAEPQGGATSAPSDGVGEKSIQPETSSTQPLAELFPQPMDVHEPIAASTKGKKNQKKSDKTPEARSAVETSDDTSDK
jgi:hypothetical protein